MASIGDVFLQILADTSGFGADVVRKAGPEADKAGQSLGQRLGTSMKQNAGKILSTGLGTVLGAGFAIASRGALELDQATQRLIADTGLVGDEAAQAKDQLASLYRSNLQGFDEIGDALAKVHTDLGLTGDAAGKTTEAFLKFGTATRQNAGEAVSRFDDILDGWNLTAEDAQSIMDKLIVSHQKFGGSVAESEDALARLAPAMQAANLTIDDGISLLNLFNTAGIDSAKATAALNVALKKVKSPEELKTLIADIAATKDPFERAQKAIELFGAKAGPQLAQALAKGNLDDFVISMDDAAGATDKAASAVEDSFGNRFQLLLKNAGGALAQFSSQFGDLALVLGLFGPKWAAKIGGAIGGALGFVASNIVPKYGAKIVAKLGSVFAGKALAGAVSAGVEGGVEAGVQKAAASSVIGGSIDKLGKLMGGRLGKVMGGFLVLAVGAAMADYVAQQGSSVGLINEIWRNATTASLEQLQMYEQQLQAQIDKEKANFDPLEDFFGLSQQGKLEQDLAAVQALIAQKMGDITDTAGEGGQATGEAFVDGIKTVQATQAADDLVRGATTKMFGARDIAGTYGQAVSKAFGDGIRDKRSAVDQAVDQLKSDIANSMNKTAEIAHLVGILTSKELADGMKSADPVVRAQAEATRELVESRLYELNPSANTIGKETNRLLADGMKSKDPLVRDQAKRTQQIIDDALKQAPPKAQQTGAATGNSFKAGLAGTEKNVGKAADDVARAGVPGTRNASAYAHGQQLGQNFKKGLLTTETAVGKAADDVVRNAAAHLRNRPLVVTVTVQSTQNYKERASGGPVEADQPYIVGEHRPELFVPETDGTIIPRVPTSVMAKPVQAAAQLPSMSFYGTPMRAETPAEIVRKFRRAQRLAMFTRPPGQWSPSRG